MELLRNALGLVDRLLGHGDHPLPVSLPLGAWGVAAASDALSVATGVPVYDAAARYAIGVGLAGTAGAMVTGLVERRSGRATAESSPGRVVAHAAGSLGVAGLYAASLAMRVGAHHEGESTPTVARGLALLGGGIALANAIFSRRFESQPRGRARLDPSAPLGLHPTPL
jgi:uncharacterized membrane protein